MGAFGATPGEASDFGARPEELGLAKIGFFAEFGASRANFTPHARALSANFQANAGPTAVAYLQQLRSDD